MNKWLSILAGLVLLIAPILVAGMNYGGWGMATLQVIKGGIVLGVIMVGLLLLLLGISELKG